MRLTIKQTVATFGANTIGLAVGLTLGLHAPTVRADVITSALSAQNNLRICGSPTECFAGDINVSFPTELDTGETGSVEIFNADPNDSGAFAGVSAGFTGDAFTPAISAYANTGDQTRFTTAAWGMQRYEFASDGSVQIGGTLTYSQSGSGDPFTENPNGRITASLFAFQMEDDVLESTDCNLVNSFGDIRHLESCVRLNGITLPGIGEVTLDGMTSLQLTNFDTGFDPISNGVLTETITVHGLAGDVFFLGSSLAALAHLGGSADARNTLLLDIDNPEIVEASFAQDTFVAAPLPVPAPPSLMMIGFGLLGLCMRRLSKQKEI